MHFLLIASVTFISAYCDTALGMGYGTILTPILLLGGYPPGQAVFAVLCSQLFIDVIACYAHQRAGNVDFHLSRRDVRIAGVLGGMCVAGVLSAVSFSVHIPKRFISLYIGSLVSLMGLCMLIMRSIPFRFTWMRVWLLSFIAAFNKGISGGGFGPLLMGGQLLVGVPPKNAVGITALAEAIVCSVGSILYLVINKDVSWSLTFLLSASALPAVPLAVLTVKKMPVEWLKKSVAVLIVILGILVVRNAHIKI